MQRLIAEWEEQAGVLLCWPHQGSDWSTLLAEVESVYQSLVHAILAHSSVYLLVNDEALKTRIKHIFKELPGDLLNKLHISVIPTNDTWIRDYGPLSVKKQNMAALYGFKFNAWGGKYPFEKDALATERWCNAHKLALTQYAFVLEGGAIDTDGQGTLLTTKRCIVSKTRNPGANISHLLAETLGAKRIHWLTTGYLAGDDTDGHVDMLARFTSPSTICYTACDDPLDEHFIELGAMQKELQALKQDNGQHYELIALPWPKAIYHENQRLPASYANFLIINHAVIVPQYNDPADEVALATIQACFPDRKVIGIYATPLIKQGGSIHCASMQLGKNIL